MLRSLKLFSLTLVCGAVSTPASSRAWSMLGHQITAKIAEQQLTSGTQKKLNIILSGDSIEELAAWPDYVKDSNEWKHTKGYHYKNIEANIDYFTDLQNSSAGKRKKADLILALLHAEDLIRNPSTSASDRKKALAFFIHFFADLHQPLHAGYANDSGGNSIAVNWYGTKTNLHSLWDNKLITSYLKFTFPGTSSTSTEDIVASFHKPSPKVITNWNKKYYVDWLNEALTMRDTTYENIKSVSDNYYQMHIGTVVMQLQKGGYRLAQMLEQILNTPTQYSSEQLALRQKVLKILCNQQFASQEPDYGVDLGSASGRSSAQKTNDSVDEAHSCSDHH